MSKKNTSQYDLFNNPMVTAAKKAMSPEELERYQKIGESLYGSIDFEKNNTNNVPPPMVEALAYVEESIKSGQHPSTLDENEKALLADVYGDDWYKKWGYVEEDLNIIVTVLR